MKYAHHAWVRLAKLSAEMQSIENVRTQKLEKEPDGFFLEASEGPYDCCICRESIPGNKIWWKPDGLRCADCWRSIQEGIIPALVWESDGVYIHDWRIKSDYQVHPSTRRKLERDGVLKGRALKRQNGDTYCTVYLVEENTEFLKRYPKKTEIKVEFAWSGDKK